MTTPDPGLIGQNTSPFPGGTPSSNKGGSQSSDSSGSISGGIPNYTQLAPPPGTTYIRNNATGEIDQVWPDGTKIHLSPDEYAQLGKPAWNSSYSTPGAAYAPSYDQQQGQIQANQTAEQDAYALLQGTLSSWGLGDLADVAKSYLLKGLGSDEITLLLQQTPEYEARFSGNAIREANGLTPLLPAQYIATENSYRQIMQSYGLPSGFYDSNSDFADFIGKDISPTELDTRAKIAQTQYINAPDYVKNLWGSYFGNAGDAIAAILDPNTATAVIQNRAAQVGIGGAGAAHGLSVSQQRAQQFQQAGVTQSQADQAYQHIATSMPTDQSIATRFGTQFGQTQEENDLLLGDASAVSARQTLYGEEEGLFKAGNATKASDLGVSQEY